MELLAERLQSRLMRPLPGSEAHIRMAHAERKNFFDSGSVPPDAKLSSVLIMLFRDERGLQLPLIVRQQDGHVHGGQVSFPGGKFDPVDTALSDTALREAEEEIGVPRDTIRLVGSLTEFYIPPSNFLVHPFVGIHEGAPSFVADTREVARVIPIRLADLMDDSNISMEEITLRSGLKITVPAFCIEGLVVWGATAMILSELNMVMKELGSDS